MNNSNLEFRKIKSLQFLYEVNSNGTIIRNVKSKKQLKIKLDYHHSPKGYYTTFVKIKGVCKRVMLHTVVAECWLGDRPEGYEVDHKDRNPHNNDYRNLKYVTHSEQMKNRTLSDETIQRVINNCQKWNQSISKPICIKNNEFKKTFQSIAETSRFLSEYYNVPFEHIRNKLKKRRSHIYDFDIIYLNAETGRGNAAA